MSTHSDSRTNAGLRLEGVGMLRDGPAGLVPHPRRTAMEALRDGVEAIAKIGGYSPTCFFAQKGP